MRLLLAATALTMMAALPALADDRADCEAGIARLRADVARASKPDEAAEPRRNLRRAERELGEREYDECAEIVRGGKEDEGPETEDMFGFTVGTDVLDRGKFELSSEIVGGFGRRAGRYRIGSVRNTFAFAPLEGLSIEIGAIANAFSIRNVPDLDDRRGAAFGGLSAEVKYQVVKRGKESPIGLTLVAEPTLGFVDEESGRRGRRTGLETRIALDAALVPDKVFAGLNLIYEAEAFRPRRRILLNAEGEPIEGPPDCTDPAGESCPAFSLRSPTERDSRIGISGGVSFQIAPNVFLGGELRYLRAYEGLALRSFEGHALFAGPTLYAKLGERFTLSAAFSSQVAGRASDSPDRRLDLDNFSRHQARLKLTYEF
ncbi:DUF6662 family protein [Salinarimonas soli]|uniref:DUF6662 family protein n=1 Tax=Salinarimonas soli TaxID=1638099 RepID=UPI0016620BE9|nr:DUF6662 family protein [Salinarimonas soli]